MLTKQMKQLAHITPITEDELEQLVTAYLNHPSWNRNFKTSS